MKKVVVVGGSAGAIQAISRILKGLHRDFPAPLLAVIHIPEQANSLMKVLQRTSALKVITPEDSEPIRPGNVYLAPANRHLIVKSGCTYAIMGPRENRHRPSVDTLFRSAARAYRESVIAVVLSGALDDGSAGAQAVKARGGTVIVQDPKEAEVPDMPENVVRHAHADYRQKIAQIPRLLTRLVLESGNGDLPLASAAECSPPRKPRKVAKEHKPVAYTCPECGGALLELNDKGYLQFRCHVGHGFSLASFTEAQADAVERALWEAIRKLRERQNIQARLASDPGIDSGLRNRHAENAHAAERDIRLLNQVLARL